MSQYLEPQAKISKKLVQPVETPATVAPPWDYAPTDSPRQFSRTSLLISQLLEAVNDTGAADIQTTTAGTVQARGVMLNFNLSLCFYPGGAVTTKGLGMRLDIERGGINIFTSRICLPLPQSGVAYHDTQNGYCPINLEIGDKINLVLVRPQRTNMTYQAFVSVTYMPIL